MFYHPFLLWIWTEINIIWHFVSWATYYTFGYEYSVHFPGPREPAITRLVIEHLSMKLIMIFTIHGGFEYINIRYCVYFDTHITVLNKQFFIRSWSIFKFHTYLKKSIRLPSNPSLQTSLAPPTFIALLINIDIIDPMTINIWKQSAHSTAFIPPCMMN